MLKDPVENISYVFKYHYVHAIMNTSYCEDNLGLKIQSYKQTYFLKLSENVRKIEAL